MKICRETLKGKMTYHDQLIVVSCKKKKKEMLHKKKKKKEISRIIYDNFLILLFGTERQPIEK